MENGGKYSTSRHRPLISVVWEKSPRSSDTLPHTLPRTIRQINTNTRTPQSIYRGATQSDTHSWSAARVLQSDWPPPSPTRGVCVWMGGVCVWMGYVRVCSACPSCLAVYACMRAQVCRACDDGQWAARKCRAALEAALDGYHGNEPHTQATQTHRPTPYVTEYSPDVPKGEARAREFVQPRQAHLVQKHGQARKDGCQRPLPCGAYIDRFLDILGQSNAKVSSSYD